MPDVGGPNLVARAQDGDPEAIGMLYDQHHESIFRYVWLRVNDRLLAEDLTGDVFVRMLAALPSYRSMGMPFRAWLYRIAHNLLVDHYRRGDSHVSLTLDAAESRAGEADPEMDVEHRLSIERIGAALAKLDRHQREVVVLRFVSELSLREVSLVLGKSEAAVKALQHRGLAALRRALPEVPEQVMP